MRTPFGFMGVGLISITTTGNWSGGNQTLTVPAGNPGTIKFTSVVSEQTAQYSKNNGTFTAFVSNDTLSVANGDTLKFRENPANTGPPDFAAYTLSCNVIDNTTAVLIGTVSIT